MEDNNTDMDGDSPLEMILTNGLYEWGFDLTDFNPNGKEKFQQLMQDFEMEYVNEDPPIDQLVQKFSWKNQAGDLKIYMSNNPITGVSGMMRTRVTSVVETGYLGYVGVECNSPDLLTTFLEEFRASATYIKGECNARVYA
jgi:hypothetical protein